MLDIEKSQVIHYGDGKSVTVYGDQSDANKYYIVPLPVIPRDDANAPEFGLVEYKKNAGLSGVCSFMVELQHDAAAEAAVKGKLGSGITFGQLSYQSAKVWFTYVVKGQTFNLVAAPAMYAGNRASFIVELPDADSLNAFKNAFGPQGGAGGTFQLQYDLTSFAKLPPATVTVQFNSTIAYQYQKTVHVSRNVWGHVTHRAVTIHQYLSESNAGTVNVDPGARPLKPALQKQMVAWANQTLEDDVNRAVNDAIRIIGENNAQNFSLSQVASFKNIYRVGQVVEWHISPLNMIPAFDKGDWGKVFSVVDDRDLRVSVTVEGFDETFVESVDVTIDYPTKKTGNSHHFTPGKPGTWIFTAPGNTASGDYDPTYQYSYVVHFSDGSEPYQSPKISGTKTEIYLALRDLSTLTVKFDGSNVPFSGASGDAEAYVSAVSADVGAENEVKEVQIEFYFVNDADGSVKHQELKLTADARVQSVSSDTRLPSKNPYQYRVTYVLQANQTVTGDWVTDNAGLVLLNPPFVSTVVNVIPLQDLKLLELQVDYNDPANQDNQNHTWVQRNTDSNPPDPWTFLAPTNTNDVRLAYDGRYETKDGLKAIPKTTTSDTFINIDTTKNWFSAQFDPSQVEWAAHDITLVVVSVYRLIEGKGGAHEEKTDNRAFRFHPGDIGSRLYGFLAPAGKTPEYHWTAEYWHKGVTTPTIKKSTAEQGSRVVVLPGNVPSGS